MECWTEKTTEILGLIWVKLRTEYPQDNEGGGKKWQLYHVPLCVSLASLKASLKDYRGGRMISHNLLKTM